MNLSEEAGRATEWRTGKPLWNPLGTKYNADGVEARELSNEYERVPVPSGFGAKFKQLRTMRGLRLVDVCDLTGVQPHDISSAEHQAAFMRRCALEPLLALAASWEV